MGYENMKIPRQKDRLLPCTFMLLYTVNHLLSPGGAYLFQTHLRGGDLFNLEKTTVSVLHKELEYEVKKLKYKTF